MDDGGIDATVARLADLEAIRTLLGRYCECLDAYDIEGVAATFSADAVADYGPGRGGVVEGRDAIAARIAEGQAVFAWTHHQMGQVTVEVLGDGASSTATVLAWHERFDGSRDLLGLRYVDRLERSPSGWRIHRRRVEVTVVEGFDGVEWNRVERHPPTGGPQSPSQA